MRSLVASSLAAFNIQIQRGEWLLSIVYVNLRQSQCKVKADCPPQCVYTSTSPVPANICNRTALAKYFCLMTVSQTNDVCVVIQSRSGPELLILLLQDSAGTSVISLDCPQSTDDRNPFDRMVMIYSAARSYPWVHPPPVG